MPVYRQASSGTQVMASAVELRDARDMKGADHGHV